MKLFNHIHYLARQSYKTQFRKFSPVVRHVRFGGVKVAQTVRLTDYLVPRDWLPYPITDKPHHEEALHKALKESVKPGDHVCIVGGGYGTTAVRAALLSGKNGKVGVFEASEKQVKDTKKALSLSGVDGHSHVYHAIVGKAVSTFGEVNRAKVIQPSELPLMDVLQLDCEGAELEIIKGLQCRPGVIIVETHGFLGAPTHEVTNEMELLGYDVKEIGLASSMKEEYCGSNDIRVVKGIKK